MQLLSVQSSTIISAVLSVIIVIFVCTTLIPLLFIGINAWHKKVVSKQNKNIDPLEFKVKFNKLAIGAAIFLVVFLIICTPLFPIFYLCDIPDGPPLSATIAITCCLGAGAIASSVFLYSLKRWELSVDDNGLKLVPYFGKCKEYGWSDIVSVNRSVEYANTVYRVYVKPYHKKAFTFYAVMVGGQQLVDKLREHGFMF